MKVVSVLAQWKRLYSFRFHKTLPEPQCLPSKHFNVSSWLFLGWYDVTTSHNVKSTLKQRCITPMLKFTTFNNVETTFYNSMLNWTTLDNVETTLSFSTSIFTTSGNVETTLWIWPFGKKLTLDSKTKQYFWASKNMVDSKSSFSPHFKKNL